jgi:type VI secretion system protein VasJ
LEWLDARMGTVLAAWKPAAHEETAAKAVEAAWRRLEQTAKARFGQGAPSVRALSDAMARIERERDTADTTPAPSTPVASVPTAPAQASEQSPPVPEAKPASPAPPPAPGPAPGNTSDWVEFFKATGLALTEAASKLRAESNASPRAYWLARLGTWLSIEDLPPADAQGKTKIPVPDRRVREALSGMASRKEWAGLLAQAEGLFPRMPLWLDLQHACAQALEGLGDGHANARAAVERETRQLVNRLPGLKTLRFSDGTPLASPETLRWLASGEEAQAAQGGVPAASGLPDELRTRLLRGEASAVADVEAALRAAGPGRAGFLVRLALAETLEAAARVESAVSVYQGLERDLDIYQLEHWEPDLARQALEGLRRALTRDAGTGWPKSELQRVCARLARIAPSALL